MAGSHGIQIGWQVNFRANDAENKGCVDLVAQVDSFVQCDADAHPTLHCKIAD